MKLRKPKEFRWVVVMWLAAIVLLYFNFWLAEYLKNEGGGWFLGATELLAGMSNLVLAAAACILTIHYWMDL